MKCLLWYLANRAPLGMMFLTTPPLGRPLRNYMNVESSGDSELSQDPPGWWISHFSVYKNQLKYPLKILIPDLHLTSVEPRM